MPRKNPVNDIHTDMQEDIHLFLARRGYTAIPIILNDLGHLLTTVVVNGVPGLFILDTGAGISLIEENYADRFKLNLQNDEVSFTGAGAGGKGLKVVPCPGNIIEIGAYMVTDFPLVTMSLQHVSQAFIEFGINEEVLGIIGVDILKPARAIIDYSSMTLYLSLNTGRSD